ncbi:ABC transporter substrate-binding protein [Myroides albus]|uniref:ABC transporter substrate-binding protein n=1 Tax=Myroides albus TaxID=2562892 RepID=A0A6I3LI90_9FLAO|nr:ABC transporter substrate-binding protein [Myroides albus]MTG97973.1 ABC transporter substrate-binding protein [Myroides albus]UVD80264.1 ABC transporter substrate-binding protein [Myroides albus]
MKSIIYYISIFCVLTFMISCQNKKIQNDENKVFRYNESANIATLDPAFAKSMNIIWPCNQIFNGLVQLDDSLHIQGDIAKYWNITKGGLQYDFILRDDVYFHKHSNFGVDSTRTVTASDFVYSFDRLSSSSIASPGGWILQKVKSYQAINDTVFRVNLTESFPAFLGLMSMRYASVVPREIVEDKKAEFRSNPIGTGPFAFKLWEENIKLVLRKNPLYFERDKNGVQLPYLEAVAVTFLPDKQSAFLQFIQGNLDFISGLDPSYKDDIIDIHGNLKPKYQDQFKMITGPYLNTEYLGFNFSSDHAIIKDKRIRQALDIGFDRNKMLAYLRNGMGESKVGGMIPNGLEGHLALGDRYDFGKAKELVDAYKKEKNESSIVLTLSTDASYLDIAEYLQREWQKIGIELKVDVMPPSTLRQSIASGTVSFFRGSWIADYPDAENYLSLFYSANKVPYGANYTRFDNRNYDALLRAAIEEEDLDKRDLMYQELDRIVVNEKPVIILFYDKVARFTSNKVENLGINPMNNLFLKKVSKKNN